LTKEKIITIITIDEYTLSTYTSFVRLTEFASSAEDWACLIVLEFRERIKKRWSDSVHVIRNSEREEYNFQPS